MAVVVRLVSPDRRTAVDVTVDGIDAVAYQQVRNALTDGYDGRQNYRLIASGFRLAVELAPDANPSDLWQHVIYRTYMEIAGSDQSWKRASGQALELALCEIYNSRLASSDLRMVALSAGQAAQALGEMGLAGRVGKAKLDIAVEGRCSDGRWVIVGGAHSKASIAERIADDVPASVAMMEAGYLSITLTMDSKSFPPPHGDGVNRGELRHPQRLGITSDKRGYFEQNGLFDACFSFNLRTPPTTLSVPGSPIITLSLSDRQPDQLVGFLGAWWSRNRERLCRESRRTVILASDL